MTILQAIEKAKQEYNWQPAPGEPASVLVRFRNRSGLDDETELNLYTDRKAQELNELWDSLYDEMNAEPTSILSVCLTDLR